MGKNARQVLRHGARSGRERQEQRRERKQAARAARQVAEEAERQQRTTDSKGQSTASIAPESANPSPLGGGIIATHYPLQSLGIDTIELDGLLVSREGGWDRGYPYGPTGGVTVFAKRPMFRPSNPEVDPGWDNVRKLIGTLRQELGAKQR